MAKRKLNEDGLVNATHKEKLSQRDSEPTHLKAGGYDDLGGTGIDSEPNSVKIDAAKGVKGQDTSIIGAGQNSEKSHLKTESEDDDKDKDVDVAFEDEDGDDKDLDKQLDEFEDLDPVDVDVDSDDDKKKVNEDHSWGSEKDAKDIEEAEDEKDKLDEDEDEEEEKKDELNEDEIVIKKGNSDDDDKGDDKKDDKDGDDKGEKKENPFAKKEKVDESLKIRITRPSVSLFESAGLSGKAQKQVATIFESMVKNITKQVASQVHGHYKKLHESKIRSYQSGLAKKVDSYLNYATEEWVKSNRVGIRTTLKSQLAEEFLGAFQTMMKEHYIDVPESKVDVVKSLTEQVSKLKKSLSEQTAQKLKLRKIAEANAKGRHIAQFARTEKLSEGQQAKLEKLAENVSYTNAKDFRGKLTMLKESYLNGGKPSDRRLRVLPEEKVEEKEILTEETKNTNMDPDVAAVVAAMNGQSAWTRY